jgi:undecaprenyl-diphosphatase
MHRLACVLLFLSVYIGLAAAENETPEQTRAAFTYRRALITGTVEGITEFLPVSSTGHMIISDRVMNVPDDSKVIVSGVTDRKGRPVTQERVADDYIVIIQVGAIAAVLVVFFGRVRSVIGGLLRADRPAMRLTLCLLIAFFPSALLGLFFKEAIGAYLFSVEVVAGALMVGGVVILGTEQLLPKIKFSEREVAEINPRQALIIGLCQCCALIPGTSRSLSTILGGRFAGLSNAAATEFSFLVGLLTLTGASIYKMWSLGPALTQVYPAGPAGLGLLVAAITAFIAVKWMVGFVSRRGMGPFAWYRIALGGIILAVLIAVQK